jgi:flagellar assembly protein FliH
LSSEEPRAKVVRNVRLSDEPYAVPLPDEPVPAGRSPAGGLEGGRQIDPYLMAGARIQDLHRTIESLIERERQHLREIDELKKKIGEEQARLYREEALLRQRMEEAAGAARTEAAERGMEEGYREGLAAGREEIIEEVREEFRARFGSTEGLLSGLLESLDSERERIVEMNAPLMVKLWQVMLERLLRREVKLDGDTTLRVFMELLPRVNDRTRIRVLVNPGDRDALVEGGEEFVEIKRAAGSFELVADEYIEKGSCLIETNMGVYDATWKSQIEAVGREIDHLMEEA